MCIHCTYGYLDRSVSDTLTEFKQSSLDSWEMHRKPFDVKYNRLWQIRLRELYNSSIKDSQSIYRAGFLAEQRSEDVFTNELSKMYNEIGLHFGKLVFENGGQIKSLFTEAEGNVNETTNSRFVRISLPIDTNLIGNEIVFNGRKRRIIQGIEGYDVELDAAVYVEVGYSFEVLKSRFDVFISSFISNFIATYMSLTLVSKVREMMRTTAKDFIRLGRKVNEATNEGQTPRQVNDLISEFINTTAKNRAKAITHTEVAQASNLGGYVAAKIQKRNTKMWLSQLDDRVREGHLLEHGTVVGIDELFYPLNAKGTRDAMRFPLDDSFQPDPSNIINCRCAARYE